MTNWTYMQTEPTLWTVGFHAPSGDWKPDSDHGDQDEAANRVRWLNGGRDDTLAATDWPPTIEPDGFVGWAIVELMGHRRLAGWLTEQEIAGRGFLRLDIPGEPTNTEPAATQLYNPASVYAITPTTEVMARAVATKSRPEPVHRWELPALSPMTAADEATEARAAGDDFPDVEPF
jgi:hypothetical protein